MSALFWLWLGGSAYGVWNHFLSYEGRANRRTARRVARLHAHASWFFSITSVAMVLSCLLWPVTLALSPFQDRFERLRRRRLGMRLVAIKCLHCGQLDEAEAAGDWLETPAGWFLSRGGRLACNRVCAQHEDLLEGLTRETQH